MDIVETCESILVRFLASVVLKPDPTVEEARLAHEIKQEAIRLEIIKIGDCKAGFIPTRKSYEKMVTQIKNRKPDSFGPRLFLWDDLIECSSVAAGDLIESAEKPEENPHGENQKS